MTNITQLDSYRGYKRPVAPDLTGYGAYLRLRDDGTPEVPVSEMTMLLPEQVVTDLTARLGSALQPARPADLDHVQWLICSAWANNPRGDAEMIPQFIMFLRAYLAPFPGDILAEVMDHLVRTSRFPPSIADIIQPAQERLTARQMVLQIVHDHKRERDRRTKGNATPDSQLESEITHIRRRLRASPGNRIFVRGGEWHVGSDGHFVRIADQTLRTMVIRGLLNDNGNGGYVLADGVPE